MFPILQFTNKLRKSRLDSNPFFQYSAGVIFIVSLIFFVFLSKAFMSETVCIPSSTSTRCPQPISCKERTSGSSSPTGPRPLLILAAGAPRAASTFLYNALRILLRIRDPNTVSGWYLDLLHLYKTYAQPTRSNTTLLTAPPIAPLNAFKSLGTTLLIKIHTVSDWHRFLGTPASLPAMEHLVDGVFTTHRDLRPAVRSLRAMGWGHLPTASELESPDFCRLYTGPRRFLRPNEYTPAAWVTVARAQIRCHEVLLEAAGERLYLDARAEDLGRMEFQETVAFLKEISVHLQHTFTDEELSLATKELRHLRPAPCTSGFDMEMGVNPITHLHKGHIQANSDDDDPGMDAILLDEKCSHWLRQYMYI